MARATRAAKELAERERWPRERLERYQRERPLGVPEPAVEVETVDALERSAGGKLQVVVAAPEPGP
ncbi:MAG: hypothetical protein ACRDL0_04090 [Thermoleophilaceae bacterium]